MGWLKRRLSRDAVRPGQPAPAERRPNPVGFSTSAEPKRLSAPTDLA